jgi:shikimate kinase
VVAVLVTGMSGTGKSTVLAELARRGFRVADTDHDGLGVERWSADEQAMEQLWDEDRVDELLTEHERAHPGQPLFVGGCVSNQGRFYPRFAVVVLLSAPTEVLLERLGTRTTNDFGKSDVERERILADLAAVEPLLRAGADEEIDTRAPVTDVADRLVRIALLPRRRAARILAVMPADPRLRIATAFYLTEIADEDFTDAELTSVAPQQLRFRRCSFRGADLRQATLDRCSFSSCDLRGAVLRGASLRGTRLTGCDLRGADLRDCDLTGATLSYQRTGDDTGRTDVTGALLAGADLTDVTVERVIGWPDA